MPSIHSTDHIDHSCVVSTFHNVVSAEFAIDGLKDAGFALEDILYSGKAAPHHHNNPVEKLTHIFEQDDDDVLVNAGDGKIETYLLKLGIPPTDAQYYEHEYETGHPVVAVLTHGHQSEAMAVMRSNGGYNNLAQSDYPDNDIYGQQSIHNAMSSEWNEKINESAWKTQEGRDIQ